MSFMLTHTFWQSHPSGFYSLSLDRKIFCWDPRISAVEYNVTKATILGTVDCNKVAAQCVLPK
jgi:hypothetical protein